MRLIPLAAVCFLLVACDYNLTVAGPSGVPNISNTNTNNNTNNNDRSDVGQSANAPDSGGSTGTNSQPLPLPTYAENVVRTLAAANPILFSQSCQDTDSGWAFLDLAIRTLRAQDQRWGYLCKEPQCVTFGRDVIAYRATDTTQGIWLVDVINDCGGTSTAIQWLLLPFDLTRQWAAARKAGVF